MILLVIIQISAAQNFDNQNYFILENLNPIEMEITITNKLRQQFIAAASPNPITKIYYEEGIETLKLIYDHEAFNTQSEKHFIRILAQFDKLYFYIGYLNTELNENTNFTVRFNNITSACSSKCTNCLSSHCMCSQLKFGSYCQLDRLNAILGIQYDIVIKPYAWQYILFQTEQLGEETLKLKIKDQSADIQMGLGIDGLTDHEIPNHNYDNYFIPRNTQMQVFYIQTHLLDFLDRCPHCSIMNIGFYNPNSFPIIFYFELYTHEKQVEQDPYHLQFILITFGFFVIFIFLFLLRKYRRKQQQQQILLIQRTFRRRRRIPQKQVKDNGFDLEFITSYFPQFYYLDLVEKYPQLSEFKECVVCLESMAPISDKIIEATDCIYCCCVTPCFHMFHQHCLQKWLLTQKCCPLCRKGFLEDKIKGKPWISLNQDISVRESSRTNPYVRRMKTRSENTVGSDAALNQFDESASDRQETQIGDQRRENITQSIPLNQINHTQGQKSARNLILK